MIVIYKFSECELLIFQNSCEHILEDEVLESVIFAARVIH